MNHVPIEDLVSIVGSLRDREVACSASDRQGSNFESCVWRTVSSQSSHHPQEVLLAQFSLYVHKGGLKPDSFIHWRFGIDQTRSSSCGRYSKLNECDPDILLRKKQCWINAGSASQTIFQDWSSIGSMYCVYMDWSVILTRVHIR